MKTLDKPIPGPTAHQQGLVGTVAVTLAHFTEDGRMIPGTQRPVHMPVAALNDAYREATEDLALAVEAREREIAGLESKIRSEPARLRHELGQARMAVRQLMAEEIARLREAAGEDPIKASPALERYRQQDAAIEELARAVKAGLAGIRVDP
jgi:hypothetical protein